MTAVRAPEDLSLESLIAQVADEFAERVERGERPEIEDYARTYPAHATVIRQVLSSLEMIRLSSQGSRGAEEARSAEEPVRGYLGDFRIVRELGRGGMGVVYEAEQISLGRRVALKVLPFAAALDAKQLQRFKNEAHAAAHLQHQNIVPVHFVGCERGVHYYAMQFIEGQTLAAIIQELRQVRSSNRGSKIEDRGLQKRDGYTDPILTGPYTPEDRERATVNDQAAPTETSPIPPRSSTLDSQSSLFFRTVANLGIQAAEALEHAHQLGVIHRDIKPANLMVETLSLPDDQSSPITHHSSLRLWITDFGLAHCQSSCELTMSGDLLGTLRYMSPEQALAKRVIVDERTDIYSLGVTLYELLTLEPAFPGMDRQEVLRRIAFEDPKPLRRLNKSIPAEFETIVLKAMEKSPADRYGTAQELADDLRRYLEDKPIRARRPTAVHRGRKWARRHRSLVWVGVVALLVVLGAIQSKGAAIQIMAESDFLALFAPTREEAIAMLKGGPDGIKRWGMLRGVPMPDLSGADFQDWKLVRGRGVHSLNELKLDGANLRRAELSGIWLSDFHNVTFDDAILRNCHLGTWSDCSAKKARLERCALYGCELQRSDFTDSGLNLEGQNVKIVGCVLQDANLSDSALYNSEFRQTDLSGADLSNAHLRESTFEDANLSGANLTNADLTKAKFVNCNLSKADLRGAILLEADLSGVISIDRANFEDANLALANLGGLDVSKAIGLDPARSAPKGKVGPNVQKLERIGGKSDRLVISARLDLGTQGSVELEVTAGKFGIWFRSSLNKIRGPGGRANSLSASMTQAANRWNQGTLLLDSVKVKSAKAPLGGKELKKLAIAAWCEVLAVNIPSDEALKEKLTAQKANQAGFRDQLLAELRGGAKGVEKWNARKLEDRQRAGRFRRVDLSGAKLQKAQLGHLDFQGANFEGAILIDADFEQGMVSEVNFKGSNLKGASLRRTKCQSSTLQGASLAKSDMWGANFRKSDFTEADLRDADMSFCDVGGANFSAADLADVKFEDTKFDDHTKFPKGFNLPEGLHWAGAGIDPRTIPKKKMRKPAGPLSAETFMKELEKHTDAAKLSKALAMLKADRFKLYAQVADDFLTGVVKSQSDPDLVYSCRLGADGAYACCTQNLNVCGGLRGSLCKHLLVLIVGLSKSGELDPTKVYEWIEASRVQKPALDKDVMSETFLRYKGAEAGEVDWRPTETIPEDYYAM